MKVLVIPEDFRLDQYLLKPLFDALLQKRLGLARRGFEYVRTPIWEAWGKY